MSTVGTALTTWDEFLLLPNAEGGSHLELRDGEVVSVGIPRAIHVHIQSVLVEWLTNAANGRGRAAQEFPYRPATNLQFWVANGAYVPHEDWQAMRTKDYPVYAPPLVIEILSPSNTKAEIARRRVVAFSGGTREFWVIDPDERTVEVSLPGSTSRTYGGDDMGPVTVLSNVPFHARSIFSAACFTRGPFFSAACFTRGSEVDRESGIIFAEHSCRSRLESRRKHFQENGALR